MRSAKPALVLLLVLAVIGLALTFLSVILPGLIEERWQDGELLEGFVRKVDNIRYDVLLYFLSGSVAAATVCALINPRVRESALSLFEPDIDPRLRAFLLAVGFALAMSVVFQWLKTWVFPVTFAVALVFALERAVVYRSIPEKLWKAIRLGAFICITLSVLAYGLQLGMFLRNMPNDYAELPDYIQIPHSEGQPHFVKGSSILDCLYGISIPLAGNLSSRPAADDCAAAERLDNRAKAALEIQFRWKAQAGRLLYHHSYVFVPAMQLNSYQQLAEQNLYGFLHSSVYAAAFRFFGENLNVYFLTYIFGIALGLCAFAFFIRSFPGAHRSLLLAAVPATLFLGSELVVIGLAPGLSPLRFIGAICILYGLFSVLRTEERKPLRVAGCLLLVAAGAAWNSEWALLSAGALLFGAALAVIAGWLPMRSRLWAQIALVCLVIVVALACTRAGFSTIQYTFLGLVTQPINIRGLGFVLAVTLGLVAILLRAARGFPLISKIELTTLIGFAFLSLSKAIWNPDPAHFFSISPILSLPFIYVLAAYDEENSPRAMRARIVATVVLTLVCVAASVHAVIANQRAIDLLSGHVRQLDWTHPKAQIRTRFDPAVLDGAARLMNKYAEPGTVFLISPYDHLLYFISGRSPGFPTHEVMTNLVTTKELHLFVNRVLDQKPRYLFASDELFAALETVELPTEAGKLDIRSLRVRFLLIGNLRTLFCQVSDRYVLRDKGALISVYEYTGRKGEAHSTCLKSKTPYAVVSGVGPRSSLLAQYIKFA